MFGSSSKSTWFSRVKKYEPNDRNMMGFPQKVGQDFFPTLLHHLRIIITNSDWRYFPYWMIIGIEGLIIVPVNKSQVVIVYVHKLPPTPRRPVAGTPEYICQCPINQCPLFYKIFTSARKKMHTFKCPSLPSPWVWKNLTPHPRLSVWQKDKGVSWANAEWQLPPVWVTPSIIHAKNTPRIVWTIHSIGYA